MYLLLIKDRIEVFLWGEFYVMLVYTVNGRAGERLISSDFQ